MARFGAGLASTPRDQLDFLRRWRALKARFPRIGKTWRGLWQAPLTNRQYRDQPFIDWLKESEPALRGKWTGKPPAPPTKQQLDGLFQRLRRGERAILLPEIQRVLDGYEHHAEATGDDYFFVRSACNLGKAVLPWAPDHALAWARDALRWSPNNGHAWDLRGRALTRLGHPDIAQAAYWEAVRRLPDNAVVRNQLARLLVDQGRELEAENLFRGARVRDPGNAVARNELARLLARTDRKSEVEALLRRTIKDLPDKPVAPYLLAQYLIAWGRPEEAAAVHARYVRTFGENEWSTTLRRLLDAGAAGVAEVRQHLADHDPYAEPDMEPVESDAKATECQAVREAGDHGALHPGLVYPVRSDGEIAEYGAVREKEAQDAPYLEPGTQPAESDAETTERTAALEGEKRGAPFLRRAAGAGRADLLFRIRDTVTAERTLTELLADDPGDGLYPQVVWALHVPGRRTALAGHYHEALGALAPHLAAAGPETPTSHWERLYAVFPERRGLIDFTRLMRSGYEEAVAARLEDWIASNEDDADAFLRAYLKKVVAEDGRIDPAAPGLEDLLNACILAAMDLGDGVLGEAA